MPDDMGTLLTNRWVDLAVGVFLLWRAAAGWRNGFLVEVSRLVGIVLAFTLAGQLIGAIASVLQDVGVVEPLAATILAYVLLLVVVLGAATTVGHIATRLAHALLLGWLNRFAGLGFGLASGLFTVQTLALVIIAVKGSAILTTAPTTLDLVRRLPLLFSLLPPSLITPIKPVLDALSITI